MGLNHEEQDLKFGAVVMFLAGLAVMLVIVHFAALRVFDHLAARRARDPAPSPLADQRQQYTGPRLLVNQALDMQKLRESEESQLASYGWIDREHSVVHIPIDRAIELLAERGLPTNIVEEIPQP